MTLIFATNNAHKVDEIRYVLKDTFKIKSLVEAGIKIEIPEPHQTLEDNAREKSIVINRLTNQDCFSEDSGLEVAALHGEPGVRSARYSGTGNTRDNIDMLLKNLENSGDRSARFRTVISLIIAGKEYQFEGICEGQIIEEEKGASGFGYDPVFVPAGSSKTFGEMSMEEKAQYSHRKKATDKFVHFLNQYNEQG
jgi:XTP/dITP diphosphohydrolase